jgi:hypothetical protein
VDSRAGLDGCEKSPPHRDFSPDRPALSQSPFAVRDPPVILNGSPPTKDDNSCSINAIRYTGIDALIVT